MAFSRLSVPAIRVNDELIRIVPNSFVYDGGEPEITVASASSGSGNSESVHSVNAETEYSMCKFSVYLTADLDAKIRDWKSQVGANNIKVDQANANGASFVRSFPGMSLGPKVERPAGADTTVDLEFSGDVMVIS